jgi:hypothetical protein
MRSVCLGLVLLGLAACQATPPTAGKSPPAPAGAAAGVAATGAHQYHVVTEESLLQILVFRGGTMARLGHNHVIASHALSGPVYVADDPVQTRFDISFPVNELSVDEPAMREMAGADFPPGVPQSARDGTRTNMLSDKLLDASNYPTIRLRAVNVIEAADGFDVEVEITLKDQMRNVHVPVALVRSTGELHATGDFPLKQSELGLKPFSIGLGMLVVLDDMRVHFDIISRE